VGESGHPLLTVREQIRRTAVILITGDRGLAGAYNSNIVRRTELFIRALGKDHPADVIAVGRKGRDLMIRRGYNVIASFTGLSDAPTFLQIVPIAQVAIDDYLSGKVDQVFIAYTDFINMGTQRPSVKQLLPLRPLDLKGMAVGEYVKHVDLTGVAERVYSYEPEPAVLLNTIVPRFTQLQVYQSVLEALASEHSARMLAMNNATDNAGGIVEELVVQRNKARQTTITSQIMDIVGGAEALVKD
jgi:F-type H+-transporting ATPase subunit gamma